MGSGFGEEEEKEKGKKKKKIEWSAQGEISKTEFWAEG